MERHDKLVRDRIPEIIEREGKHPTVHTLDERSYQVELLKKLIEESCEVMEAIGDREALTKELSDVQELIDAIVQAHGLDAAELAAVKQRRLKERGGFENRTFLEGIE